MLSFKVHPKGFTLIELIVVFSIMAVLATAGIAAFVDYSRQQSLNTVAQEIKTMLLDARSRASSQVSNCLSGQQFNGYEVLFCPTQGILGYTQCDSASVAYQLDIYCGSTKTSVTGGVRVLPSTLSIVPSTHILRFASLSGNVSSPYENVSSPWTVSVTGYGKTSPTISVYGTGVIK